ncbi:MAG: hypothetical protein U5K27_05985 [Desulfotignum sp.]|nr:hypothetical protein [Desulfotignum sp.]
MSSATRLYLEPDPGGSGHRDAYYDDLSGSAYDDIFTISLVEDYSYDILTVSYLEPYSFFGIGDFNGIMLDMESEYLPDAVDFDGVAYQARLIYDFEAPYTGDYYIQPGWNPGSYFTETAVLVTEYAPDNTILGVQQTTVDDNVAVY